MTRSKRLLEIVQTGRIVDLRDPDNDPAVIRAEGEARARIATANVEAEKNLPVIAKALNGVLKVTPGSTKFLAMDDEKQIKFTITGISKRYQETRLTCYRELVLAFPKKPAGMEVSVVSFLWKSATGKSLYPIDFASFGNGGFEIKLGYLMNLADSSFKQYIKGIQSILKYIEEL